jgi:hypothetical protein
VAEFGEVFETHQGGDEMNFDEPGTTTKDPNDMLPDGEHVGLIISAQEEVMNWEKNPTCIVLEIKVLGFEAVRSITPCWKTKECAAIFRAAGIEPRGEVNVFDLVQKKIAFTAIRTISKANKEFVRLDAFRNCSVAAPIERAVQQRQPVRTAVARKVNEESEDIPF